MAEGETDLERAQAKAAGLERWFRARLRNGLTRLLLVLFIVGGTFSALTSPHALVTAAVCVSICAAIAVVMTVRTVLILRELRNQPEQAVARLTKWRKLKRAGFTSVA